MPTVRRRHAAERNSIGRDASLRERETERPRGNERDGTGRDTPASDVPVLRDSAFESPRASRFDARTRTRALSE